MVKGYRFILGLEKVWITGRQINRSYLIGCNMIGVKLLIIRRCFNAIQVDLLATLKLLLGEFTTENWSGSG